jgi:protein-tyrosine-phosphatase
VKNLAKSELAEQLAGRSVQEYKSIPVQRSGSSLKDDRSGNIKELYKEAADVQKRIKDAKKYDIQPEGTDNVPNAAPVKKSDAKPYKGPSVLSWTLDGRNAFSLPIPVYKCQGGGDVSVRISVGRNGYVTSAQIIEGSSVSDECIRAAALNAAKRSRFSASETAPNPTSSAKYSNLEIEMQYSSHDKLAEVQPEYTLDSIERHAVNIRDNAWDINSGLRSVLAHLRGEELTGKGVAEDCLAPSGKLVEVSLVQQGTRRAQDETFQLVAELKGLLNANA